MIPVFQIIISVALIISILLQTRGGGTSGLFGGDGGGFYQARRGLEKALFWGTIALAAAFIGLAVVQLLR